MTGKSSGFPLRYILNFFLNVEIFFFLSSKYLFFVLFLIDLQHHWEPGFFHVVLSWPAIDFKTHHIIKWSAILVYFCSVLFLFLPLSHWEFPGFAPLYLYYLNWLSLLLMVAISFFPAVSSGFLLGLGHILFPVSLEKDW